MTDKNKTDIPWDCDAVQFPRLIAELNAVGAIPLGDDDRDELDELCASMGLEIARVEELVDRARATWDEVKDRASPACPSKPYAVVLDDLFYETERGHILLEHVEENYLNAWITILGPLRLEIAFRTDNYPALVVQTVNVTDEELAVHINKEFDGGLWYVRKCNIDGVNIVDNHVGTEDEAEDETDV